MPADTVVFPVNVLAPERVSVPAPVFVRAPACPETFAMTPPYVSVWPDATWMVPTEEPSDTPRLLLSVKPVVTESVPPLITTLSAAAGDGTAPRLVSADTSSTPALTVTPPVCRLVPLSVNVPLPCLVMLPLSPLVAPL